MQITIVTAVATDEDSGTHGWAAAGQSTRGTFQNGGKLIADPADGIEARLMASINGVYHAINGRQVNNGDTIVLVVDDIEAMVRLAIAAKGGGLEDPITARAASKLAYWQDRHGITFKFRCTTPSMTIGEPWQHNAASIMAQAAAANPAAENLMPLAMC